MAPPTAMISLCTLPKFSPYDVSFLWLSDCLPSDVAVPNAPLRSRTSFSELRYRYAPFKTAKWTPPYRLVSSGSGNRTQRAAVNIFDATVSVRRLCSCCGQSQRLRPLPLDYVSFYYGRQTRANHQERVQVVPRKSISISMVKGQNSNDTERALKRDGQARLEITALAWVVQVVRLHRRVAVNDGLAILRHPSRKPLPQRDSQRREKLRFFARDICRDEGVLTS